MLARMDPLAALLAREARDLGLSAEPQTQEAEALQTLACRVLEELHARGLISGPQELDCWAGPRRPEH